jgi:hypothetical protein
MSESKSGYVLHFVWLEGCGGCVSFKKTQLGELESMLRNHSQITFKNQEYKRDDANRHLSHLAQYISWFPTFILTQNDKVVGVFNGTIENKNGSVSCEHANKMPMNAQNVLSWAETLINKPPHMQDTTQSMANNRFVSKTCRSTNNYRPSN